MNLSNLSKTTPARSIKNNGLRWLLLIVLGSIVLYPMLMLVYSSFLEGTPGQAGSLTLDGWRGAWGGGFLGSALVTTVRIVAVKVAIAMILAISFAWIIGRTNTPMKGLLETLLFAMWFTPTLPVIIAWIIMASPRVGLLNKWLEPILPMSLNAYSYEAVVILGAVNSAPILFIFLLPAFRNMDASLEESARMSGAGFFRRLWHITLPLMLPAILSVTALIVILSFESFEVEVLLGLPAGLFVFTTRIFDLLYLQEVAQFGKATALAMALLGITLTLIIVQRRILANREFTTITGKGYRPTPMDLGRWKWVTFSYVIGFFLIFGLLPLLILFANSFMLVSGIISVDYFTLDNWREALTEDSIVTSIRNTLILGAATATIGVVVVSVVSYVVTKTRIPWKGLAVLDIVVWLPIAVPGLVLALGMLWAYVRFPIYNTLWIIVLAFLIRGLPTGSRFFVTTMVQVSNELEESARIHGASWARSFFNILLPLLRPAVISAWVFLFVLSVRQLDSALILGGPKTQVLQVTIFQFATRGSIEVASALGLLQTVIVFLVYLLVRFVGGRGYLQNQSSRPNT